MNNANPPNVNVLVDRNAVQLAKLLDEARVKLIDGGARNRLIHTNRTGKRPYTVSVLSPDTDRLFARVVGENASLRFHPDPAATARERKPEAAPDDGEEVEDGDLGTPMRAPASDGLPTRLGLAALDKRLTRMQREAKTLEEEQGINILYLAIGFLRWYEDDTSEVLREAPLVLVPAQINRDIRRSTFDLAARPEDITANVALTERLRGDFGIVLPEMEVGDDWTPSAYFARVAEAISGKPRWSIDAAGVELGFFSFAKLLMFTQLQGKSWLGQSILFHPLLRGLMRDGFAEEAAPFSEHEKIDARFHPSDLMHVRDADGSQTLVIETVRLGRNLVVQGPPGTGKSQTIANIIAAAVHDNKTVLFVAEKMVALKVVGDRLNEAGLGAACLELHSRNANKRTVVRELERTLGLHQAAPDLEVAAGRLALERDTLNAHAARMHEVVGQTGMTPFQALGVLARSRGVGHAASRVQLPAIPDWPAAAIGQAREAVRRLAERVAASGPRDRHGWFGVERVDLQPMDLSRLEQRLADAAGLLRAIAATTTGAMAAALPEETLSFAVADRLVTLLGHVQIAPAMAASLAGSLDPLSIHELHALAAVAAAGERARAAQAECGELFKPAAFQGDHGALRSSLVRGTASFFARFGRDYRLASAELASLLERKMPKPPRDRVALVDWLIAVHAAAREFERREMDGSRLAGPSWRGIDTDFMKIEQGCRWFLALREQSYGRSAFPALDLRRPGTEVRDWLTRLANNLRVATDLVRGITEELRLSGAGVFGQADIRDVPVDALAAKLSGWGRTLDAYDDWGVLSRADRVVRDGGLPPLADAAATGAITAERLVGEFDLACAEAVWQAAREADPALGEAAGRRLNESVARFHDLEHARRRAVGAYIAARHLERIPRGSLGEMAIIRGEAAKKRSHMAVRKLMEKAGRSIQAIKPVFLMSPLSVAQLLPPGALEFDLLVIDEASQVRPEDALGVIARSRQIVVVGDSKQLPPTNFFGRLMEDNEAEEPEPDEDAGALASAAKVGDLESILSLCTARKINARMLRWHYRSRHPSLIAVSNAEFYGSGLLLPPSPSIERGSEGFVHQRVQGVYERGGRRVNTIEARAVVAALAEHARVWPERTVGIVTFSVTQRDEVLRLIDEERRVDATLNGFLTECADDVFVKNLENVQGDERDVILISVGYGPSEPGARATAMHFGPVSGESGERRLNVLFTRARLLCKVFVSFDSGDIDLARAKGEGARVLKRFLAFAETGVLDQAQVTGLEADSPFEEDVAREVAALGYPVDMQVGSAGFRIDLGVRHPDQPGRYILAIECDGATYHSALWARERDRMRQEVLEQLGWRFHRIWSTDWFYRRSAEIERLRSALAEARAGLLSAA